MTVTRTPRLNIHLWSSGSDTFTRDQLNASHQELENRVAIYNQNSTRPTASAAYEGALHYNSTTGQVSYCNGSSWFGVNAVISTRTPSALNGSSSAGSTSEFSDAGHRHAFSNNSIALSKISTSGASNNHAIGYDASGQPAWLPLVPDGSVTLAKFSTTRTDWDSSATSASDLAGKLIGFNSSGQPAVVDSSSNINSVGLEHIAHLTAAESRTGPTQRVLGFNASGTPVIVDNVPSRSVGLNQLATGTANKLLGFDSDGNPAVVDPTPADGSITLGSFQTVSGNANKLVGYNASGVPTARDPFVNDGSVALSALASGTAGQLIGYNSSGNAAAVPNAPSNGSIQLAHFANGTAGKVVGWGTDGTPAEIDLVPTDFIDLSHIKHQTGQANKVFGFDGSGNPAFLDNVPSRSVGLAQMATGTANRIIGFNSSGNPTEVARTPAANSVGLSHLAHGTAGKVIGYNSSGEPVELDLVPDNSVGLDQLKDGTANTVLGYNASGAPAYVSTAYGREVLATSTSLTVFTSQWQEVDLSANILDYDLISVTHDGFHILLDARTLGNAATVTGSVVSITDADRAKAFSGNGVVVARTDANTIRVAAITPHTGGAGPLEVLGINLGV